MIESEASEIYGFNKRAMECLRNGEVSKSEKFLIRAQNLLKGQQKSIKTSKLWAITCNNLACVYRSSGDFENAMKNLFLALETEEKYIKNSTNIAGIHLNISSIYSQMKLFKHSLQHSQEAQRMLLEHPTDSEIYWMSLITSYLDIGLAHDNLNQKDLSLIYLKKGFEMAENRLGVLNVLTVKLKRALQQSLNMKKSSFLLSARSITPTNLQNLTPKRIAGEDKSLPLIGKQSKKRIKKAGVSVKRRREKESNPIIENTLSNYPTYLKAKPKVIEKSRGGSEPKKKSEKNLVLESDDEGSLMQSISEDIETKKMCDSVEPNEKQNKEQVKTSEKSVECNLIQSKKVKDEDMQTEKTQKIKECQVNLASPKFRRIAAILIQKQWRAYKLHTNKSFKKANLYNSQQFN